MTSSHKNAFSDTVDIKNLPFEKDELSIKTAFLQSLHTVVAVFLGFVLLYLSCIFIGKLDFTYTKPFQDMRHMLKDHALLMRASYLFIAIIPLLLIVLVRGHLVEWLTRNLAKYSLPAISHLLLAAAAIWSVEVIFLLKNYSWPVILLLILVLCSWVTTAGFLSVAGELALKLKNSEGKFKSWIEFFMAIAFTVLILYFLPTLHLLKLPIIDSH